MANRLSALPWQVDTPSANPLFTGKIFMDHIVYVGYANDNDEVEVQDRDGNTVILLNGNADLSPVHSDHEIGWVAGLKVPVTKSDGNPNMSNGYILIYIK